MVINGAKGLNSIANTVEIVDLRSNGSRPSCSMPDYPIPNVASFGGLVNETIPLVCGGVTPQSSSCYYLVKGSWQQGKSLSSWEIQCMPDTLDCNSNYHITLTLMSHSNYIRFRCARQVEYESVINRQFEPTLEYSCRHGVLSLRCNSVQNSN
jgi:hypothetical protein